MGPRFRFGKGYLTMSELPIANDLKKKKSNNFQMT